jgi:tRNA(Ile)-lysidine synthase
VPGADAVAPFTDRDFAARLDRLGPFEAAPHLAVGVSGGADSLALTLLANRWARARDGRITALTVDHGLRTASAAEAVRVGQWLAARGIAHRVLSWSGPKPGAGLQAAARAARRELLAESCRQLGILHLLLAHHADDQAETIMMRIVADSGPDGMAGIAAVVEHDDIRVVRPLLDVRHERLMTYLRCVGQEWIEDPSNRDARFTRTALRGLGAGPDEALGAAGRWARERSDREGRTAAFLAQAASVYPEGWIALDVAMLRSAPEDLARRAVARAVMTVGGLAYPPRGDSLRRLIGELRTGSSAGHTLGGCLVRVRKDRLHVIREPAAIGPGVAVAAPGRHLWDERFALTTRGRAPAGVRLAPLGEAGWARLLTASKSLKSLAIPATVGVTLPTLWDLDGVLEVYHLLYRRKGADPDSVRVVSAVFRPRHRLCEAGFAAFEPSPPSWGDTRLTAGDDRPPP